MIVCRDRNGKRIREWTNTNDWQDAHRKLRERLQARDDKILEVVRKGEHYNHGLADFLFLENDSEPSIRAERWVMEEGLLDLATLVWALSLWRTA
jgi:hypothetical protein